MSVLASFTSHLLPIIANYSQALGGVPLFAAATAWYVKHQCHRRRCFRLAWHPHPVDNHPVCKRHHPQHPAGGVD